MNARAKLNALIDECGGPKAFAGRVGISESLLFKVLAGKRQFGKRSATKIESKFPGRIDRRELVWIQSDSEGDPTLSVVEGRSA